MGMKIKDLWSRKSQAPGELSSPSLHDAMRQRMHDELRQSMQNQLAQAQHYGGGGGRSALWPSGVSGSATEAQSDVASPPKVHLDIRWVEGGYIVRASGTGVATTDFVAKDIDEISAIVARIMAEVALSVPTR